MDETAEAKRLQSSNSGEVRWKRWGPYLSERAWGTVREDYSPDGRAWDFFPHDHARSKAYRWGEDGLAGISDEQQYLCFALALWNGQDPILKERLFGLTGNEGNHGEDVKEYYFYLDSTPTHSFMRMLYKYPQREFPYRQLIEENRRRGLDDDEFELLDTNIFDEDRYFDVTVEYAKAAADDILIRIHVTNHGPETASITVLPTLWFRNTWAWGYEDGPLHDVPRKPTLTGRNAVIHADHPALGRYQLYMKDAAELIFTENDTNVQRLYGIGNPSPYVKDAFHRYIINGEQDAVNPQKQGTKAAAVYPLEVQPGATVTVELRLSAAEQAAPFEDFAEIFSQRQQEADAFYNSLSDTEGLTDDQKRIQRQALAGMLWSKQLFYYDMEQWLNGDPVAKPPQERWNGRNREWRHLNNFDIVSMPDKWEYPWYAGWDLAFHCIPLTLVDPKFAKDQLLLLTREWYMHPNGQLPAYEWAFGDVNPPVHAWAAWRVYEIDGMRDRLFLKRIFNKMLLNFNWWINRKDMEGRNIFQGGFLGLDNISLFDRSAQLPTGGTINQSDGTAWMGFFCLTMLNIALELSRDDLAYEDMAIKFYEHFLAIAAAMSGEARHGVGLWDEEDGFFYDVLELQGGEIIPLKVRSLVGLLPLIAVETVGQQTLDRLPEFARSINWLQKHRPALTNNLMSMDLQNDGTAHLFAIPTEDRLRRVLTYLLDENEFLSPYGIRSLSKAYQTPYHTTIGGQDFSIEYWPAESHSSLFGGNSNWRGPIWFPINYLLIEALKKYYRFFGEAFRIEYPTGSGVMMTLNEVADDLARRLCSIFLRGARQERPVFDRMGRFQHDPHWCDMLLFHEYFHGDNGAGLGASHQTGWTGLVADLLRVYGAK
ncbi:MAG: glucosidase [bacterium]|nr:glucosidase [bacterium]